MYFYEKKKQLYIGVDFLANAQMYVYRCRNVVQMRRYRGGSRLNFFLVMIPPKMENERGSRLKKTIKNESPLKWEKNTQ